MMKMRQILFIVSLMLLLSTSMTKASILLDYGTDGLPQGLGFSGANGSFGGFTTYQSFTVTSATGWQISTIGIDGFSSEDPNNVGLIGTIVGDILGTPDDSMIFGSATYFLNSDTTSINWVDEIFDVFLPMGTYWFRAEAGDADFDAVIRNGITGDMSLVKVIWMV